MSLPANLTPNRCKDIVGALLSGNSQWVQLYLNNAQFHAMIDQTVSVMLPAVVDALADQFREGDRLRAAAITLAENTPTVVVPCPDCGGVLEHFAPCGGPSHRRLT